MDRFKNLKIKNFRGIEHLTVDGKRMWGVWHLDADRIFASTYRTFRTRV